ncbi:MAG: beta-lactamase family protein [Phycisphaeraceae bacterium]|nr:beta-lactamase family protein [Phycisphaeraceae bacterium]
MKQTEAPADFPPGLVGLIRDWCDRSDVGVQVGVALGGFGVLLCGSKSAPISAGAPGRRGVGLYKCASQAKPVVAVCAVRLAAEGRIGLDEPVVEVLPDWPEIAGVDEERRGWVGGVTLRRLLSHTAGFTTRGFPQRPVGGAAIRAGEILAGCLGPASHCRIEYEPGTKCVYSGAGYVLAQMALEARTGRSLRALVRETVFEPLGMVHSRLGNEAGDEAPTWYELASGRYFPAIGSSGLYSTVEDLAVLWYRMGGGADGVVDRRWTAELFRPHSQAENGFAFGLGFALASGEKGTVFKHAGWCEESWVLAEGVVGLPFGVAAAATVGGEQGKGAVMPVVSAVTRFVVSRAETWGLRA